MFNWVLYGLYRYPWTSKQWQQRNGVENALLQTALSGEALGVQTNLGAGLICSHCRETSLFSFSPHARGRMKRQLKHPQLVTLTLCCSLTIWLQNIHMYIYIHMPDQVDSNLAMAMFGEGRNILTSHLLGFGVDWPGSCDVLSTFPIIPQAAQVIFVVRLQSHMGLQCRHMLRNCGNINC